MIISIWRVLVVASMFHGADHGSSGWSLVIQPYQLIKAIMIQHLEAGSENYSAEFNWCTSLVSPKLRFSLELKLMELERSDRSPL